jgi:hypothetical protein
LVFAFQAAVHNSTYKAAEEQFLNLINCDSKPDPLPVEEKLFTPLGRIAEFGVRPEQVDKSLNRG